MIATTGHFWNRQRFLADIEGEKEYQNQQDWRTQRGESHSGREDNILIRRQDSEHRVEH
jgi:hypothetical protein